MVKSWNDRLNTPGTNGIKPSPRSFADVVEGQTMLVPTARQVDDFIRAIPVGVEMDVRALRTALAIEHGAEVTCPVTIGYHLRTVAEAANEDLEHGMALSDVAPFWRVLDERTPTTKKLSFGATFVAAQRRREGLKP
ncbi:MULTISPECIES: hypothetical protein [unclassified Mesorhizobium]|uniref:hypothetical protein n=1 Tax=unclassified Mesorhizobium TaxID=325217 RepID=UPI0009602C5E|nr:MULTISPECIES: hypothetical protein [unclassified Mesorhizobium]MBN9253839.1 hypothetical protein [Mesorhizobium sp.]MBN9268856.1 hypothetical protein [Mesorhizobium sp.]OJX73487.1 MAG: hypothetical protein BGO93_13405 [Mesorhizobium sp. 65-26]